MNTFINQLIHQLGFWASWLLIPILFEIIPTLWHSFRTNYSKILNQPLSIPQKLPMISIILPVYNSEKTLFECIESIVNTTYPKDLIQMTIVNNNSQDNSFREFGRAQVAFPNALLQWIDADQGKAKALNSAIYNSIGQYIINLDTDGILQPDALRNLVLYFENNPDIDAAAGAVLTNKKMIQDTKKWQEQVLRVNEYFEYLQACMFGRSMESAKNQLFTMSGAFSAFKRETLVSTYMYNVDTVGEDTDMTFQIRERLGKKVGFCYNAIFYVEPIDGVSELYTQRQRWQRGQVDVSSDFLAEDMHIGNFFKNFMVSRLMVDHTFLFPRLIWTIGLFVLVFYGYSAILILASFVLMYLLYVLFSILIYWQVNRMLTDFKQEKKYLKRKWWVVLTLPLYNMIVSIIRFIGIINMITNSATWRTNNFKNELKVIKQIILDDLSRFKKGKTDD